MNIPILMYHSILPSIGGNDTALVVDERNFEKQMAFLKLNGYTGVLLKDLCSILSGNAKPPKKPIVITFDDALVPVERFAKPILDNYGFKAVIFVVPTTIGKHNVWDAGNAMPLVEVMSVESLKGCLSSGWEIGSHSMTHADLQSVTPEKLREEVAGAKEALESLFDVEVSSFCYPYGSTNEVARQAVIDAGYKCACAIFPRTGAVTEDIFRLKRVSVLPADTLADYKKKISPLRLRWRQWKRK